jgi:hypothetical protein
MYRMIGCAAAVLVAAAVQPVIAEDTGVCTTMADESVAACTRILALNPNDVFAYDLLLNRGRAVVHRRYPDIR